MQKGKALSLLKAALKWVGYLLGAVFAVLWIIDSDFLKVLIPIGVVFPIGFVLAAILLIPSKTRTHFIWASLFVVIGIAIFITERMGFEEEAISFQNAGAELKGTLYLPTTQGPHPTVVIAHGSPCIPRRLYHAYAKDMAVRGVAVFSFDKRGTGKSGGVCNQDNNVGIENLELLASDMIAGLDAVRQNPKVDETRLGLWGLSQGGWIGPMVAQKYPDLGYMVLVSGPTVSVGEETYYSQVSGDSNLWARDEVLGARADALVDEREPSQFDPYPLLEELSIPALWVFGGKDGSIPVKKNIKKLKALQADGKPYDLHLYPSGVHILVEATFPFDFSEGFQKRVADWILAQKETAPK